ncbi:MAG: hypothetical protein AAF289_12420, partial [Cyanobacteria bacterium P01_A01_bin.135]
MTAFQDNAQCRIEALQARLRALEAENHLLRQTADQPNLAAASGINRVALRDRLLEASAQTVSALLT